MATPKGDGLQVIGGGLMRTGTTSLHVALEKLLGGKCYHMKSVAENPGKETPFWIDACKRDLSDDEWRDFFKDYTAAVDFPPVAFYERLMQVYPNAKVVLTVRDPEKWYQSVNNVIAKVLKKMTSFPMNCIMFFTPMRQFPKMVTLLFEKHFKFDITKHFEDRPLMIQAFEDHVDQVKRTVPPEKLLVFEAVEGWSPLCDFLGVPVPDEPYPRLNTTEDFGTNVKKLFYPMSIVALIVILIIVSVCISFVTFAKRYLS